MNKFIRKLKLIIFYLFFTYSNFLHSHRNHDYDFNLENDVQTMEEWQSYFDEQNPRTQAFALSWWTYQLPKNLGSPMDEQPWPPGYENAKLVSRQIIEKYGLCLPGAPSLLSSIYSSEDRNRGVRTAKGTDGEPRRILSAPEGMIFTHLKKIHGEQFLDTYKNEEGDLVPKEGTLSGPEGIPKQSSHNNLPRFENFKHGAVIIEWGVGAIKINPIDNPSLILGFHLRPAGKYCVYTKNSTNELELAGGTHDKLCRLKQKIMATKVIFNINKVERTQNRGFFSLCFETKKIDEDFLPEEIRRTEDSLEELKDITKTLFEKNFNNKVFYHEAIKALKEKVEMDPRYEKIKDVVRCRVYGNCPTNTVDAD